MANIKISIDEVLTAATKSGVAGEQMNNLQMELEDIVRQAELEAQARKAEREAQPKKEAMVYTHNGTSWIIKTTFENYANIDIIINKAIKKFNNSKKGAKAPIESSAISDAFEYIPGHIWREFDFTVITKQPALVYESKRK